jgi:hypothetical protein
MVKKKTAVTVRKKQPVYVAVKTEDLNPGQPVHLIKDEEVVARPEALAILLANGHIRELKPDEELEEVPEEEL